MAPALQRPGAVLVDATLGLGGHTEAVLDRCAQARVVGLDRDPMALELAAGRLARFGDRVRLVQTVYDAVDDVVAEHGRRARPAASACADAVLFDLGVSSLQLDRASAASRTRTTRRWTCGWTGRAPAAPGSPPPSC